MNTPKLPPLPHWCEAGSPFAEQMQAYAIAAITAQGVPEIDYEALIAAAHKRDRKWAQGTNGCIAFKYGAEWFRDQFLASAPPAPQATGAQHLASSDPVAHQQAITDHAADLETRAEIAEQQVVCLAEERDHFKALYLANKQDAVVQQEQPGAIKKALYALSMLFDVDKAEQWQLELFDKTVAVLKAASDHLPVAVAQPSLDDSPDPDAGCGLMPLIEDYVKAVHDGDDQACRVLKETIEATVSQYENRLRMHVRAIAVQAKPQRKPSADFDLPAESDNTADLMAAPLSKPQQPADHFLDVRKMIKAKPLSDEQVGRLYEAAVKARKFVTRQDFELGIRAAEAAHGIKE